jgi:hypothetical protein
MSRYSSRRLLINDMQLYEDFFKDRNIKSKFIEQYESPVMAHPTVEEIQGLDLLTHIWSTGDRYFKLADRHYGDPELWWIIAWFNQKPTESHLILGDVIYIPFPLDELITIFASGA